MSERLIRQIDGLKQKILNFGAIVERAIANAGQALIQRDADIARKVFEDDREIDRIEVDIEEECLKILALYQPVAGDLRFVVSVFKINNDLERMGDLAKNVAKRAVYLSKHDPVETKVDFRGMAEHARQMVSRSLDALVRADSGLAQQVRREDATLDAMRRQAHAQIRERLKSQPREADALLKYYSVAKHLERLGDMATNVAEDVIYMVEGTIVRHQHDEDD